MTLQSAYFYGQSGGDSGLGSSLCVWRGRPVTGILWLDFDMKNIPEPKEPPNGFYDYFFKGQIVEHTKQNLDIPRWARRAGRNPRQMSMRWTNFRIPVGTRIGTICTT